MSVDDEGYQLALAEQKASFDEGGSPVGGCLVSSDGKILGRGRNMSQVHTLNTRMIIGSINVDLSQNTDRQCDTCCLRFTT